MRIHYIKSEPKPFKEVWEQKKRYEVRNFDREYAEGDRVYMLEWDKGKYTGRLVWCEISHVTNPNNWGIPEGLCVFGFEMIDKRTVTPQQAEALRQGCPVHMRFQVGCMYCEREGK